MRAAFRKLGIGGAAIAVLALAFRFRYLQADGDEALFQETLPGLGVELETKNIVFASSKCVGEAWWSAVGKPVRGHGGDTWKLSGDTSANITGILNAEYVMNGKQVKLGAGPGIAGAVAADMVRDMSRLERQAQQGNVDIEIVGHNCNPWKIQRRQGNNTGKLEATSIMNQSTLWGAQITAPMPLAMMNRLFGWQADYWHGRLPYWNRHVLRSASISNPPLAILYDFFRDRHLRTVGPEVPGDDFLGFLAVVLNTIKRSSGIQYYESPKHDWEVMPRTDFTSMLYSIPGHDRFKDSLYALVQDLLCYEYTGEGYAVDTSWCVGPLHSPTPVRYLDQEEFYIKGIRVSISAWLDSVQVDGSPDSLTLLDRVSGGSIGGLGSTLEGVVGAAKGIQSDKQRNSEASKLRPLVPLFEWRTSMGYHTSEVVSFVRTAEKDVLFFHDLYHRLYGAKSYTTASPNP